MKKIFYSYIIISSIIVLSLLTSALTIKYAITGEVYTDPEKAIDNSYTLFANEFDFENQQIDQIVLDDSYHSTDLLSIESDALFPGAVALYGGKENASNSLHGFLELYSFSNIANEIVPQQMDLYTDGTIVNETEYVFADVINTTADGKVNQPTIYALKKILPANYTIDIIDIKSNSLSFNSSYAIDGALLNTTYGFAVEDINNDDVSEVYVLGLNGTDYTKFVILEFSYNLSISTFYLSNSLSWSLPDHIIIDVVSYTYNDYLNFIITGFNTNTFESYVQPLTLFMGDIRNFVVTPTTSYSFGSDRFRVYSMNLFRNVDSPVPNIVLIGSYLIGGIENYLGCLTTSYDTGVFTPPDLLVLSESLSWSINALIADIDLDQNDEIIQTSYDLIGNDLSNYTVLDSAGLIEVDHGTTGLSKISASAMLYLSDMHIGSFLGENQLGYDTLEFYSTQHVQYQVKSNAEIIVKGENNDFLIESLKLNNVLQNRTDFNLTFQLLSEPLISFTVTNLSNHINLDLTSFSYPVVNDTIILTLTKGDLIICEDRIALLVEEAPNFSLKAPEKLSFTRTSHISRNVQLKIRNNMQSILTANISAFTSISAYEYSLNMTVGENTELTRDIPITFDRATVLPSYTESVTVSVITSSGTFVYNISILIQNKNAITGNDLFIALAIAIAVIVLLFIALLNFVYRKTKDKIDSHLRRKETLALDLKLFETKAINDLAQQYLEEKNWQMGLLLTETHNQDYLVDFNKIKARELIATGQDKLNKGLLQDGLEFWLKAREPLEIIGNHELIDTFDFQLQPLVRIVEAVFAKKGDEKASSLQKEFSNLSSMKSQRKYILGVEIEIPLYLVAVQTGLAYKTIKELETSLNYLQIAYQDAPEDRKHSIVTQITSLIALGVKPSEIAFPIDQASIQERIAKRETRCFSCGEVMIGNQEKCPNCELEPVLCSVCKLPVSFGSETAQCPQCENVAHKEHLLEWIKVKGTCPVCQKKLMAKDLETS